MPDLPYPPARPSPRQLAVGRAMRDYGHSIDHATIGAMTDMNTKQVLSALDGMHRTLRVQKFGEGYWELTAAGRAWLLTQEVTRG